MMLGIILRSAVLLLYTINSTDEVAFSVLLLVDIEALRLYMRKRASARNSRTVSVRTY